MLDSPLVGQGLLIIRASRSHSDTPESQRPLPNNTQHTTLNNKQTSMHPVGFEPTIQESERPQTHALDRAASGIGN